MRAQLITSGNAPMISRPKVALLPLSMMDDRTPGFHIGRSSTGSGRNRAS
jgi:hypothetical protein